MVGVEDVFVYVFAVRLDRKFGVKMHGNNAQTGKDPQKVKVYQPFMAVPKCMCATFHIYSLLFSQGMGDHS